VSTARRTKNLLKGTVTLDILMFRMFIVLIIIMVQHIPPLLWVRGLLGTREDDGTLPARYILLGVGMPEKEFWQL
jgi:hypothetical protein